MQTTSSSNVNLNGMPRQEAHALDNSPRKKGHLWSLGSMRGRGDASRQPSTSTLPRGWRQVTKQKSLVEYSEPQRTTFILEKQDNESFGFEIQTYDLEPHTRSTGGMCTFVCTVHTDSPAHCAGLTAGDVILSVNGRSIQGSSHQHVVKAVRQSANVLKIETVCGTIMKRVELENKRSLLKQTLREKWAELQQLVLQEQQLGQGGSTYRRTFSTPASTDSSLASPGALPPAAALRWPSDSSFRGSVATEEEEDGNQISVFGDPFSPSPGGGGGTADHREGRFRFSQAFLPDLPEVESSERRNVLPLRGSSSTVRVLDRAVSYDRSCSSSSSSSSSYSSSTSSSSSSSWSPSPSPTSREDSRAASLFGTLPRKGRKGKGSVRVHRHLLSLIPGFQRSVEEEEPAEEPEPRVLTTGGWNRPSKGPFKAFS